MTETDAVDVVVLGSGAAGLVAALAAHDEGASVAVFEKSDLLGGTSAMSGGIIWMPNNHLQADAGVDDSRTDALAYLDALALGQIDSDLAAAFVDNGPQMLEWVERETHCGFALLRAYPDYHPEHPGGRPDGGRSIDNDLFSFDELGDWAHLVRMRGPTPVMLRETPLGGADALPDLPVIQERLQRNQHGNGLALVGALLRSLLDRGVAPAVRHRAEHLVVEDGRVVGAQLSTPDGTHTVRAERAVILATGGFASNPEMVRSFLRGPMTAAAGSPENTGDAVTMAMEIGARLGNMRNAWWVPVIRLPGEEQFGAPKVSLVLLERTRPGSIMVNSTGRRFCNEAGNYNAMGGIFHQFDAQQFAYTNLPAWLVFDGRYRSRYDVAGCPPGERDPDWMLRADTIEELAVMIDVPGPALAETIERFNAGAQRGVDPDFGRGESAYDTFNGDQTQPGVAATLGPLTEPPWFAVQIESGALDTSGGPKTDANGRVLAQRGGVIPGLYAAGNAMAAPTGMVYGGAGGTLGPAMTFGWIAGRHAAGHPPVSSALRE